MRSRALARRRRRDAPSSLRYQTTSAFCASPPAVLSSTSMRRALTAFLLLALALWTPAAGQTIKSCGSAPLYETCEIEIEISQAAAEAHPNPYMSVELRAEFRSPKGGTTRVIPAFWDGGRRFVIRFAPFNPGRWDFRLFPTSQSFPARRAASMPGPRELPGSCAFTICGIGASPRPRQPIFGWAIPATLSPRSLGRRLRA